MIEYKSVSLADQVYEMLENAILRGEYASGELVSENKLAQRLGVSRTPVREAMMRLAAENLIRDTPAGTLIVGIHPGNVKELLKVKKLLEPEIAPALVQNINEENRKTLLDIVEQQDFYVMKEDYEKVMRLDTSFHDAMYHISDSTVFGCILSQTHHKLLKYRLASLKGGHRLAESTAEHRKIVEALDTKNVENVRRLLLVHVERAYRNMMREMEKK